MKLGTVDLISVSTVEHTSGETVAGIVSAGLMHRYRVTDRAGLDMDLADILWSNGERDVRALSCRGPRQLLSLGRGRLRLTVSPLGSDLLVCDLRQARVKLNTKDLWSNLFSPSWHELAEGPGVNAAAMLRDAGAVDVDTKQELVGEAGRSRGNLCAVFPATASNVPAAAFVLTRVLPLKNMYWAAGSETGGPNLPVVRESLPEGRRRYVVLLDATAGEGEKPQNRPWVYVGQTGIPIEERFRHHKLGYKASPWVRRYGIRLMPELYEDLEPIAAGDSPLEAEHALAEDLRREGYGVKGGH